MIFGTAYIKYKNGCKDGTFKNLFRHFLLMSGPGTGGWDEEALELETKASASTCNAVMLRK